MSKVIHNPALAKIIDNSDNSSTFVIEPLHFNYGNTLGNSMRRVLLSSIRLPHRGRYSRVYNRSWHSRGCR